MNTINQDITLDIDGMGIVLYSPGAVKDIPISYNFLMQEFNRPEDIGKHIRKGDVTAFCTGSPGRYCLKFRDGYPGLQMSEDYPIAIRLGIQVSGGKIHIIDLFWLMDFDPQCPQEQTLDIADGYYHITALTKKPVSGRWGDNQIIYIYLNELPEMPELTWNGAPMLFKD
ncbi:hypothetical protein GPL15_00520 [Clostridium sp. MCC353]|uniref:hypothetical protein n=1 Tax=Clostridium sp. MCC353 TaxID=2592646 RepID=UPI001C011978|nr:hypothetical protein [Clostridium sp. MCC353]MBT9774991.1 hypothetical protein [Clostridium sp. MCC353]